MCKESKILPRRAFSVREAASFGVGRARLAAMVASGELRRLMAGVYAPVDAEVSLYPELEILAAKGSEGVVALESALRLHDFTTALPSTVYWAVPKGAQAPRVDFPCTVLRISGAAYDFGIERHEIAEGLTVKVYSAAKTVADLFKFRSRVGVDVAIEALREGLGRRKFTVDQLVDCAKIDRVHAVISPYVESMLG